jgi:hypothetical protein
MLCDEFFTSWNAAWSLTAPDDICSSAAIVKQLPQLAESMPAILELMHWFLQLPRSKRRMGCLEELLLDTVQQVQQVLALPAVPDGCPPEQSSGKQAAAVQAKQAAPGVAVSQEQTVTRLPPTALNKVRSCARLS